MSSSATSLSRLIFFATEYFSFLIIDDWKIGASYFGIISEVKKVKASWIVSIPYGSVIKVKKGEKVTFGQLLLEGSTEMKRVVGMQHQLKGLSSADITQINDYLKDKVLNKDEVIFGGKGWFSKKILCPDEGKFAGIDELLNIHLVTGVEKRKSTSPTEAIVSEITDDELKLTFSAEEYLGRGLNMTRVWVSGGFKLINTINDINFECKDRIILVSKMMDTIRLKAEVVGVGAIVVLDENNQEEDARINFKIPGLAVSREVYNELLTVVGKENVRALVNGNSGRLLLVV